MFNVIKEGLIFFLSAKCYNKYFLDFNFFDVTCFKIMLSKGLGMGIIAGSMLVKVPQVIKIVQTNSGTGINLVGVLLDLLAITFHMSYNFVNRYPFSSWGDSAFLAIQTAAIAVLVLYYDKQIMKSLTFLVAYVALLYILNTGLTPMSLLTTIQSLNIPILLVGKLSQALTNYRNGSTGQLSAATLIMLFAGSLARIFTSIQETGDNMIIITFCASTFANGIILFQLIYYWKRPAKIENKQKLEQKSLKAKSDKVE